MYDTTYDFGKAGRVHCGMFPKCTQYGNFNRFQVEVQLPETSRVPGGAIVPPYTLVAMLGFGATQNGVDRSINFKFGDSKIVSEMKVYGERVHSRAYVSQVKVDRRIEEVVTFQMHWGGIEYGDISRGRFVSEIAFKLESVYRMLRLDEDDERSWDEICEEEAVPDVGGFLADMHYDDFADVLHNYDPISAKVFYEDAKSNIRTLIGTEHIWKISGGEGGYYSEWKDTIETSVSFFVTVNISGLKYCTVCGLANIGDMTSTEVGTDRHMCMWCYLKHTISCNDCGLTLVSPSEDRPYVNWFIVDGEPVFLCSDCQRKRHIKKCGICSKEIDSEYTDTVELCSGSKSQKFNKPGLIAKTTVCKDCLTILSTCSQCSGVGVMAESVWDIPPHSTVNAPPLGSRGEYSMVGAARLDRPRGMNTGAYTYHGTWRRGMFRVMFQYANLTRLYHSREIWCYNCVGVYNNHLDSGMMSHHEGRTDRRDMSYAPISVVPVFPYRLATCSKCGLLAGTNPLDTAGNPSYKAPEDVFKIVSKSLGIKTMNTQTVKENEGFTVRYEGARSDSPQIGTLCKTCWESASLCLKCNRTLLLTAENVKLPLGGRCSQCKSVLYVATIKKEHDTMQRITQKLGISHDIMKDVLVKVKAAVKKPLGIEPFCCLGGHESDIHITTLKTKLTDIMNTIYTAVSNGAMPWYRVFRSGVEEVGESGFSPITLFGIARDSDSLSVPTRVYEQWVDERNMRTPEYSSTDFTEFNWHREFNYGVTCIGLPLNMRERAVEYVIPPTLYEDMFGLTGRRLFDAYFGPISLLLDRLAKALLLNHRANIRSLFNVSTSMEETVESVEAGNAEAGDDEVELDNGEDGVEFGLAGDGESGVIDPPLVSIFRPNFPINTPPSWRDVLNLRGESSTLSSIETRLGRMWTEGYHDSTDTNHRINPGTSE